MRNLFFIIILFAGTFAHAEYRGVDQVVLACLSQPAAEVAQSQICQNVRLELRREIRRQMNQGQIEQVSDRGYGPFSLDLANQICGKGNHSSHNGVEFFCKEI